MLEGANNIESHFALVNYQVCVHTVFISFFYYIRNAMLVGLCTCISLKLPHDFQIKQIRTALAIASLLGRTLVRIDMVFWHLKSKGTWLCYCLLSMEESSVFLICIFIWSLVFDL